MNLKIPELTRKLAAAMSPNDRIEVRSQPDGRHRITMAKSFSAAAHESLAAYLASLEGKKVEIRRVAAK